MQYPISPTKSGTVSLFVSTKRSHITSKISTSHNQVNGRLKEYGNWPTFLPEPYSNTPTGIITEPTGIVLYKYIGTYYSTGNTTEIVPESINIVIVCGTTIIAL